jgi:hypothetical protein
MPTDLLANLANLPALFDGCMLTPDAWLPRRAELLALLQRELFGHLPPAPAAVRVTQPHGFAFPENRAVTGTSYRLVCEPSGFTFRCAVVLPAGPGPWPVIVDGDGCWRYISNEVILDAVARGYGIAYFDRLEIVPDNPGRDAGLHQVYPDGDFGALAAWAWGYHRVVDALLTLPRVDAARIAATGHSRGGKTALLAGAVDTRIALTAPNNSGAAGAGCFRFPDPDSEGLEHMLQYFSYWYAPDLARYLSHQHELPFDMHMLKAAVAPRALLTTEARGDIWASPHGTYLTHLAAREVYSALGAAQRIGVFYRDGEHNHTRVDWQVLLDFADWQLYGKPSTREFNAGP